MLKESIYFYQNIGKVVYRKKTGIKRLTIKIKPTGEINVTIPFLVSFNNAERFVLSKTEWIQATLRKIREKRPQALLINDQSSFQTYCHTLRIIRYEGDKLMRKFKAEYVEVYIPFESMIESPSIQEFIMSTLTETYRREAKVFLPDRVKHLAELHSFRYNKISVKNMKSRWGSCSGKNNINLNIHLMSLPEALRDYVILHELVHTVEKNHGPRFWQKLETICPGSTMLRKEVRKYSAELRIF